MAITNGYTTLADAKARLGIGDTTDDTILERVIEAVSRAIDAFTGTRFYVTAGEVRVFTATSSGLVLTDDLVAVTSLKTDDDGDRTYERTWASTDYDLGPDNAAAKAEPWWKVEVAPLGRYSFPTHRRGVQITGSWGYASSTPSVVSEACLIQTGRIFKRKDSPFGVIGSPDVGAIRMPRIDVDVAAMLNPYRRIVAE
jgi:hypothetical protein